MPRLDTYISQRGVPATTGQPEVPMALGTQQALISGAEQLSSNLAHSAYIQKIKEHTQAVAEQTTAAAQLLLDLDRQVGQFANELAQPYDPTTGEGVQASPQRKKASFNDHVGAMEQDTLKAASEVGGIAQQYVMTHIRTITDPHLQAFGKGMDKLRNEVGEIDLYHSIMDGKDQLVARGADIEQQKKFLEDAYYRGHVAIEAGFTTAEKFTPFLNNISKEVSLQSNIRSATANPTATIMAIDSGTDNFPPAQRPALREAAVQAEAFTRGQYEQDRKDAEAMKTQLEEKHYLTGLQLVGNGNINSEASLRVYSEQNFLKPENYHTLQVALQNKANNVKSDQGVLQTLQTRFSSMDPKKWPTDGEIWAYAKNQKLSTEHAMYFSNHGQSKRDEIRKEGISNYRQAGMDAEKRIDEIFAPFIGSIMDFKKDAALAKAQAKRSHQDLWNAGQGNPDAPSPLSWIDKVTMPHLVNFARQQRFEWETSSLRKTLPIEADTVDKVLALRKEGKITAQQAETASEWLRLLDTLDVMTQTMKPSTSSSTENVGGVKRNR